MFLEVALQSWRLFGPDPIELACVGLLPWKSLALACSCGGCWLRPGPTEVQDPITLKIIVSPMSSGLREDLMSVSVSNNFHLCANNKKNV